MKPLRIGVCGTAHWAEAVHLPGLSRAPGFELVGVFGRSPERTQVLSDRFAVDRFSDFDAFLDAVDAVSFAVPPAVQAKLALQAVNRGKHVIVEKPVAPTVAAAEAIGRAVRETGVGAVCFLTRNFIPELLDFIAEAKAVGVTSAESRFLSSALTEGSPYADSEWRQERNASLWDVGPHLLTGLTNLLGDVDEVAVLRGQDDGLSGDIRHRDGRSSRFTVNQRMPLGPLQEALIAQTQAGEKRLENLQYDRVAAFGGAAAMLLRAVAGDAAARSAFDSAIHLVRILAAAEESVEAGGVAVPVPVRAAA